MAWLPPSCNPLDRRLWLPGGRTESLFPLGPQRRSWTISSPTATRLPSPRLASGLSGTTHTPSPPCASSSPDPCSANSADARSAAFHVYNTVVLEATADPATAGRLFRHGGPRRPPRGITWRSAALIVGYAR